MAYATLADLERHAPPGSIQDLDTALKEQALEDFSAEAAGYIPAQYRLALEAPYDPALVRHVCAGAIWQLMTYKGFNPELASNEVFKLNHERAIAWLRSVARGEVSLAQGANTPPIARQGGARISSGEDRGW